MPLAKKKLKYQGAVTYLAHPVYLKKNIFVQTILILHFTKSISKICHSINISVTLILRVTTAFLAKLHVTSV